MTALTDDTPSFTVPITLTSPAMGKISSRPELLTQVRFGIEFRLSPLPVKPSAVMRAEVLNLQAFESLHPFTRAANPLLPVNAIALVLGPTLVTRQFPLSRRPTPLRSIALLSRSSRLPFLNPMFGVAQPYALVSVHRASPLLAVPLVVAAVVPPNVLP